MAEGLRTPKLTQLEFEPADFPIAEAIATALGYGQTAYTSTSALWGLFCLKENPAIVGKLHGRYGVHVEQQTPYTAGCVIKTLELGFLFVQGIEDLNLHSLYEEEVRLIQRQARKRVRDARPEVIHTLCRYCDADIEGIRPFKRGDWRDRGNNWTCNDGKHKHAPRPGVQTGRVQP